MVGYWFDIGKWWLKRWLVMGKQAVKDEYIMVDNGLNQGLHDA